MPRLTDRPPPPPGSPLLPPRPRTQLPPPPAALQQRAWAALALAILSLLAMMAIGNIARGGYVAAVALAVAILALVLAVSAMSQARRAGARRPRGAISATVLGAAGSAFSGLALVGFLLFSAQLQQYVSCLNAAGSGAAARQACQQQLNDSISREVGVLGGR